MTWYDVTLTLDPFYLDGIVWVVFGSISNSSSNNFIFWLLNAETGENTELGVTSGDYTDCNLNGAGFVVVALVDETNREIIGVDFAGYVHTWDLPLRSYKQTIFLGSLDTFVSPFARIECQTFLFFC